MEVENFKHLIKKYLEGKASRAEQNCVDQWYNSFDNEKDLYAPGQELSKSLAKGFDQLKAKLHL